MIIRNSNQLNHNTILNNIYIKMISALSGMHWCNLKLNIYMLHNYTILSSHVLLPSVVVRMMHLCVEYAYGISITNANIFNLQDIFKMGILILKSSLITDFKMGLWHSGAFLWGNRTLNKTNIFFLFMDQIRQMRAQNVWEIES